jgi:hypothetical protein
LDRRKAPWDHRNVKAPSADRGQPEQSGRRRIFLLSPANLAGLRGRLLLRPEAKFDLALRLRREDVPLGEAFAFISGL